MGLAAHTPPLLATTSKYLFIRLFFFQSNEDNASFKNDLVRALEDLAAFRMYEPATVAS
jgi:hypothetical protein